MKRLKFKTLRARLTFWFLALTLIPLFICIVLTFFYTREMIKQDFFDKLTAIRDLKVVKLDYWLDERLGDIKAISENMTIRELAMILDKESNSSEYLEKRKNAKMLISRYLKYYDAYREIFLINPRTGVIEISTNPEYEGIDKSNDDYFKIPLQTGEIFIKDIYYSNTNGDNEMSFSVPVFSIPGGPRQVVGILVLRIDLNYSLYPLLMNRVGLGETGETLIVNKDVIALNELRWYKDAPLKRKITAESALRASQGQTGITITKDYLRNDILAAYTYIPRTKWGFVSKQNISELNMEIYNLLKYLIVIFLISALIILLIILLIVRKISKPIVVMNSAAQKIKRGDYSTKLHVKSGDELASLANSFNEMTTSIESNITNQKKQTLELEIQREQLKDTNKELESFSYSVSHDLRAPLRAINGFTKILIEEYASKFDEEGLRIGSVIQENASKMGNLIDDLLGFSRLGRASLVYSSIDMKNMANSVYYEITTEEEREKIEITITDLPRVKADTNMMRQVWINLISNAVKFSSNRKQPVISISCKKEKNQFTYCIKDNGTGFNMKYKDNLFAVFKRLHSEKEFKGTGVGLALALRIISRHNGKIWAVSSVDKGAEFYFMLPKT